MRVDRRGFLRTGTVGAAGAVVAGCASTPRAFGPLGPIGPRDVAFAHGVASGDPLVDRVILWTRVTPGSGRLGEPIPTRWWIAENADGRRPVAEGRVRAAPDRDYTVKVDATGLEPGRDYFYGFEAEGAHSPVGRTRTLPEPAVSRVRLAFASCSNYPAGYFNGYANLAARDDLDVVLHLGDYLYEYANGEYGDGSPLDRVPAPDRETISLDDYRARHATYKSDPDLQAAHARHPWITVWDDHESANNSHRRGAQNHDAETEGDWGRRRYAAIRAYSEWMPVRELLTGLFRQFRFGDLLDLVMLDSRLHGRDPIEAPDEAIARDPARSLLGRDQTAWLLDALSASKRDGVRWRVIGQQVVLSPSPIARKTFNPDAWDGYRANRARILDHVAAGGIDNLVFLSGDVHSSWAFEVPHEGQTEPCALEFVAPAISSPAMGRGKRAARVLSRLPEFPFTIFQDVVHQGYGILDLTPERARAEFVFTGDRRVRDARAVGGATLESVAGSNRLAERASGGEAG